MLINNSMKRFTFIILSAFLLISASFVYPTSDSTEPLYHIDIDGDGNFDALTDGLLILRNLFGLTGESLTAGALATEAVFVTSADIESRINALGMKLDIDESGSLDALTDGLIILRYLFGLTGESLINNVIAIDAQRTEAPDIQESIPATMSITFYYMNSERVLRNI